MIRTAAFSLSISLLLAATVQAVDLESFFFNDADGTALTAAANTANPGNTWFYDPAEEAIDQSSVQGGSYELISGGTTGNTGFLSRFLDIAPNATSGTVYLATTFSDWDFGAFNGDSQEDIRFAILDNDTGVSGQTITAQVQIQRNTETQAMELLGQSFGTAGSFSITNTVELANTQSAPFQLVLSVDLDSDSFEVFYKDGANPTQVLGLGGVSRVRNANSIRWVTDEYGVGNIPPVFTPEFANVDSIVLSDANPLSDLITLEIDRLSGDATLINNSGAALSGVSLLEFFSESASIDESMVSAIPATISDGQSVPLGAGVWTRSPVEDVRAQLTTSGGVRTVDIDFVGNSGLKWIIGDLDFDGALDADDYAILTANAESGLAGTAAENYQLGDLNGDGLNNVIDFGIFKDDFIAANGAPAFALLLAGVPEPTTATLLLLSGAVLAVRRRCRPSRPTDQLRMSNPMMPRHTLAMLGIAAASLLQSPYAKAQSILLHDFQFGETAGTDILNLTDSAGTAFFREVDDDNTAVVTNGLGQLDLSAKNNNNFGSNNLFDLTTPLTEGLVFGVLEATWDFQSTLDTNENEQFRLSLINSGNSFVTAEVEIERTDDDVLVIGGQAVGTGASATPIATLNEGSLTQNDNFVAIVQADLTADTYEVFYSSDNFGSFTSVGTGTIDPTRGATSVRLVMNNDFSDDNLLIDRVRIFQNELPFDLDPTPPELLTLQVDPVSGYAAIVNPSGEAVFDIDYYRILSSDDSLIEANWNSLQDQGVDAVDGADPGAAAGDSLGETWTEAGGSDAGVLSESFLLGSSTMTPGRVATIGGILGGNADEETLTFEYRDPETGNITIGNVLVAELLAGDYNVDGVVDAADYTVWRDNASGLFTPTAYTVWADNYDSTYATGLSIAVPEPGSAILMSLIGIAIACRRSL